MNPERDPAVLHGRCLCGQVEYEIDGRLGPIDYCHCSYCRRASGSAFASNASVLSSTFRVRRGEHLIKEYESSAGKFRCFCSDCGSPIYARMQEYPEWVRVRMGTLDSTPDTAPSGHYDVESKASWYTIADDLPQFDAQGNPVRRS